VSVKDFLGGVFFGDHNQGFPHAQSQAHTRPEQHHSERMTIEFECGCEPEWEYKHLEHRIHKLYLHCVGNKQKGILDMPPPSDALQEVQAITGYVTALETNVTTLTAALAAAQAANPTSDFMTSDVKSALDGVYNTLAGSPTPAVAAAAAPNAPAPIPTVVAPTVTAAASS
jgi:hypothetical protein